MRIFSRAVFIIFLGAVLLNGCGKDNPSEPEINESSELAAYLESNSLFFNSQIPVSISAKDLMTYKQQNPSRVYVIDLRDHKDFVDGHIEGAVQINLSGLLRHVKSINPDNYDKIVLVCYAGQTSAYGAGLMRVAGYGNVYNLKWGMSSWDTVFAKNYWLIRCSNSMAGTFVKTAFSKAAPGEIPAIHTGKRNMPAILEARVTALMQEGFVPARSSAAEITPDLSKYYIIHYGTEDVYTNVGHFPGAVHYENGDFKLSQALKTIPSDRTVAVYCQTAANSGYAAAYLRVLGYDAKLLMFGENCMIYDQLKTRPDVTIFTKSEIMYYPYVKGE